MNSIQKQVDHPQTVSHEDFVTSFEKNLLAMVDPHELELLFKKLQFLGFNFDPFIQEVSLECQSVMDNLGITLHLKNPYLATNILLRLLDKTEERLNNLRQ